MFVDIGAHRGQSAAIALEPRWGFARVVSVEPDPAMVAVLTERFAAERDAGRYSVAPVALSNRTGEATLHGDNSGGGASLIGGKFSRGGRAGRTVALMDWPSFVATHGLSGARLVVKINAEGAEVDIIDAILAHPDGPDIHRLMVDYDIIKTPFGAWKKWRSVASLKAAGIPFDLAEDVMVKSGPRTGLANWLASLPDVAETPEPALRPRRMARARIRYLELVSAAGIRHDILKRRRRP